MNFIKSHSKIWIHIVSVLVISLAMFVIYLTQREYYEHTDSIIRDYMFELRGEIEPSGNVVIVDIDEKSLLKYGQWPWSRDLVAKLIDNIMLSGAYVTGLDMVFAEEDKRSPHTIAKTLGIDPLKLPNYDALLADIFSYYNSLVVGGIFLTNSREVQSFDDATGAESSIYIERGGYNHLINFQSTIPNIQIIQDSLYSNGFLNTVPDKDGTVRSVPIVMKSKTTGIYPSLALEIYKVYLGKNGKDVTVTIEGTEDGVEGIYIDNSLYIPTDRFGRILVNYRGKKKTFEYISALDVIEMNEGAKKLNERFVFLGTSALGLFDMRPTPFDSTMPGVEIHATVLDNLLMDDFITASPDAETIVLALILFVIIISVTLFASIHEYLSIPLFIMMLYALYFFNYELLFHYHFVINIIIPLLSLIISFIVTISINFILTSSQKKVAMHAFAKKVSPAVMDDLIQHDTEGLLIPIEREVSVFFSDIRSFTSISEKIGSPKKLIKLLNTYMTPMVDIIIDEKGTVDKFIGDAIMAYWNAPIEMPNHADNAVRSAIKQIETLQKINIDIKKEFGIEIEIGIGINTGVATIGDMGSEGRSDYTIIGDHVNLASRLEGLTKQYKAKILITADTKDRLKGKYTIRSIDLVKVKGKKKAVSIFEIIVDKNITDNEIQTYEKALALYRDEKIKESLKIFQKLYENSNALLYDIYIKRCKYYIDNPDISFDVALTMTTK